MVNYIVVAVPKAVAIVSAGAQIGEGAPGKSAYQIAIANGFVGTEAEWLASLAVGSGASGAVFITRTAGEALGGHRAVILREGSVFYADSNNVSHADLVVGVTAGAAALSSPASIQTAGELIGLGGLIQDHAVYLATQGTLTQTPPSIGFVQQLGIALSPTTLLININNAIEV